MIDLTCSVCRDRGRRTYSLPVLCYNCGLRDTATYSHTHEALTATCPNCGTRNLHVDNAAHKRTSDA